MKRYPNETHEKYIKPIDIYPNEIFVPITDDVIIGIYDYYLISNYGRIFHQYLGIFIKYGISGSGYLFTYLSTLYGPKMVQIHRLVLSVFNPIPNSEIYQVNHKDGNKLNPRIGNLEWVSRKDNVIHAYNTGLNHRGETNVHAKVSDDIVNKICELLQENKYTNLEISRIIGGNVTPAIVSKIKTGNCWTHISKYYSFNSRPRTLFTDEMVNNICMYFQSNNIGTLTVNQHSKNALDYYGYNTSDEYVDSVRKIYNRKYYIKISCSYKF